MYRRMSVYTTLVFTLAFLLSACAGLTPADAIPAPTETPEPALTDTPELAPTETPEPEPTNTPEPEPEPTDTPEPEPTDTPAQEIRAEVVMRNNSFQPQEITVQVGTSVIWTNEDSFGHTVTAGTRSNPSGLFQSGNVSGGGDTFEFTFDQPGTYPYFCDYHVGMNGTVTVQQ